MHSTSGWKFLATQQAFLNKLDADLWKAADKLRQQLDAANYKHIVLGLIFLKYVSDSFSAQQEIIKQRYTDPTSDFYLDPTAYSESELADILNAELEERDNYAQDNVFWVPQQARWDEIKVVARANIGDKIWGEKTFKGIANLIDDDFDAIEQDNPKLKNVIQRISPYKVDESILLGLIDLFSDTNFTRPTLDGKPISLAAKDILGHVYEYFLGQFALAEGKKGGQYFTPKSIVTLIIEMLEPYKGRIYDPAMGSGGFFVQTERFIREHQGNVSEVSIFGQEFNPTTWKLAAMNMAIRGIEFDFGKGNADTFSNPQHRDKKNGFCDGKPTVQYERLVERKPCPRPTLAIRHTARRQRQLCVATTYDLPPFAKRTNGVVACQRLNVIEHQQRRRNPQKYSQSRPCGSDDCPAKPTLYQHPNSSLYLDFEQKQNTQRLSAVYWRTPTWLYERPCLMRLHRRRHRQGRWHLPQLATIRRLPKYPCILLHRKPWRNYPKLGLCYTPKRTLNYGYSKKWNSKCL